MPSELPRILVVDDSPTVLEVMRHAFENDGFVVDTALNLNELEARRQGNAPDAIVIDVRMPEAWGDDVAATLRGMHDVAAPIVLVSTLDDDDLARRAEASGVDGWVSKRDGVDRVVARVRELLRTVKQGSG